MLNCFHTIRQHCLELFYFVALHRGVSEAARKMPWPLTVSSVSRQLTQLEREIGTALFQRRPFRLTPPGEKLFAFIQPHFGGLPGLIDELRRGVPDLIRLGASPIVLREYMPSMVRSLRRTFPQLRLTFNEGLQFQIEEWFKQEMIDLAVTTLDGRPPEHCLSEPLLRLPMILLVHAQSELRSATELWRRGRMDELLICPKPEDVITRCFRQGLGSHGIEWPTGMEANSIELVETFVAERHGIGVSLEVPGRSVARGLRALPLRDFPRVDVGMIWRQNPNAAVQALMKELRAEAKRIGKGNC